VRAEEQARFTIQATLARGLGATQVAREVGLARASEVWGGDVPRDRPAWYVWLAGVPGAYQLELLDAEALRLPEGEPPAWHGRYAIRHYPGPGHHALDGLSPEERAVVAGGLLDATGTPRIEVAASISPDLFVVGTLEWAAPASGGGAAVALTALDRLRERDGAGAPARRDVAAWQSAVPLLSALAGAHAQIERQALSRLVLARQPGFELVRGPAGPAWRDTADAVQGQALLLFGPVGHGAPPGGGLVTALHDPEAEVLADERFHGACRHPASLAADARLPLEVRHAWFGGAARTEDRIACAC
jgi:hypothetical protein